MIEEYRRRIEQSKGKLKSKRKDLSKKEKTLKQCKKKYQASLETRAFIQQIIKDTQDHLSIELSSLVSIAMQAVFEDPYEIELEFVDRRGKVELDVFFKRNGERVDPLKATGGGAVDLAALALRFSCWAISRPRTRNTMSMDEPLKWLKGGELPEKGSQVIKEISSELGIQIIMVSHSPELIASADKVFGVSMSNGISKMQAIK